MSITEISTLALHDALPILAQVGRPTGPDAVGALHARNRLGGVLDVARGKGALVHQHRHGAHQDAVCRSEEHTSELQSRVDLVCRLLLEKKKTMNAPGGDHH